MTRRYVELHDEKWIKKHCICKEDVVGYAKAWAPKVYGDDFAWVSTLLADADHHGMYKSLVGKTIEVEPNTDEPRMDNYGFRCIEGAPYSIPTWLIKAYWEVTE